MSESQPESHQISGRLLVPAVRCLREQGVPPEALLDEVRIPREAISDPDIRVEGLAMFEFLKLAADRSDDPAFGLHAGQWLRPGDMGLLEYLIRMSATPDEISQKLGKYHRLAGNLQPDIEREGNRVVCRLPPPSIVDPPPIVEEYNLSFWSKLARTIQGTDMRPVEVMFTHQRTPYAAEAEEVFGAPVKFGCARNGLVYELEVLATGIAPVDSGLRRAIGARADEALAALGDQHTATDRVRAQIRAQLRGDGVSAELIAKALGMSARTLRRRLEEEGESFQDLRDAERKEQAMDHARETQLSISEIAYLLGFAETSAFHRAFKRWTGMTPAQYRNDQGNPG